MPPYDNDISSFSTTCQPSSSWAFNSKNQSSCDMASTILGACSNVPGPVALVPLNATTHYSSPDARTANQCTCSWLAYNLLSACAVCQGFDTSNPNWDAYSENCATFEGDGFFPSSAVLGDTIYIPVWAAQDPTKWTERNFDLSQVEAIVAQDGPDIKLSPTSLGRVLAGGVIGGIIVLSAIVLVAAGLFVFRMFKRGKNKSHRRTQWRKFDWKQFDSGCSRPEARGEKSLSSDVPHQEPHISALPAVFRNTSGVTQALAHLAPKPFQWSGSDYTHVNPTGPSYHAQPKPPRTASAVDCDRSLTSSYSTRAATGHEVIAHKNGMGSTIALKDSSVAVVGLESVRGPSPLLLRQVSIRIPSHSNSSTAGLRIIKTNPQARRSSGKLESKRNEDRRKSLPKLVIMNT